MNPFGVDEPQLDAIAKSSVDQGLGMVARTVLPKSGMGVRHGSSRSPFAGAIRRAGKNKVAASRANDAAAAGVDDAYKVARKVEDVPAADYMNRYVRARQGQVAADSKFRSTLTEVGRARVAAQQIKRGPGYASTDAARSLQWQAQQAANATKGSRA